MPYSVKLTVRFGEQSLGDFERFGFNAPWDKIFKDYEFRTPAPALSVDQLATSIEDQIIQTWTDTGGAGELVAQVYKVWADSEELSFQDEVQLQSGDTVRVEVQAMPKKFLEMRQRMMDQPMFTDKDIKECRATIRFGLNDRVLCNCGVRWLSGHIVGTAVPEDDCLLPYLVKTDPLPGIPTRTISVPSDSDNVCIQEVCFDPWRELHLIKAAAIQDKPKLRFPVGEKVVCRIRNTSSDGLEQWVPGTISGTWPKLSGPMEWDMGDVSGRFPEQVPYSIDLESGKMLYCHRDDHTLIRRAGLEPQTRLRGISKRLEVRKKADGSKEKFDHSTERGKRLLELASSDSE
jgi:hypothetical protein